MKQRVFYRLFGMQDILQCAFDGIDRIVLRGQAVGQFHEGLGELWRQNGNEVIPPDIQEIQGTATKLGLSALDLGEAMSYRWDYIEKEPIAIANQRSLLYENAMLIVEAERGECFITNRDSKYRARLDGTFDGHFILNMQP